MRIEEANIIRQILDRITGYRDCTVVDVGSSVDSVLNRPGTFVAANEIRRVAAKENVNWLRCDIKNGQGIDIVGDFYHESVVQQVRVRQPLAVLCANVLEHVSDVQGFADNLQRSIASGSFLVISVPKSYPFHNDPIDNLFRPDPDELGELFSSCDLVEQWTCSSGSFGNEVLNGTRGIKSLISEMLNIIRIIRLKGWRFLKMSRFFWLLRNYEVTIVLLRKR